MTHTTQIRPDLETLARDRVIVYTPGTDDRTDQMANTAQIRRLPANEIALIKARVRELGADRDEYTGRYHWMRNV